MKQRPVLLVGGAGIVGSSVARFLRAAHPELPLLIGGRNLAKAKEAAATFENAQGVPLDFTAKDLGLGDRTLSAVAVFFTDERLATLRFAQSRGVPHVSISRGMNELAPEVASYIHHPAAAPIVLGTEWLVGATTIPAMEFAKAFGRIDHIKIGALLDDQDAFGPAAYADYERQTQTMPAALARRNGVYVWRTGEEAQATFRAADGVEMRAIALSPNDVLVLAEETGAANVEFNVAMGESSSRRRGEPPSTEIIIELSGEDPKGRPLRMRHAVIHPEGQIPPTALGVSLLLERLLGLDGKAPAPAGLYFPYQLLETGAYLARFEGTGGRVFQLDDRG